MKFSKMHHKAVSMVVLVAFVALIQGYSAPAPAAAAMGNDGTAIERGGDAAPGSFEKQSDEGAAVKKKKKFPWLLAGLGAVAIGVALYFLVIKKTKYTLTVTLEKGITGAPLATSKYKKGEVVRYSYFHRPESIRVQVTIDGAPMPAFGSIVMDRDHAIAVGTAKEGFVQVNSTPSGAKIYVDGADSGQVTPARLRFTSSGIRHIALRHQCGRQDWNQEISVELGREATINAVLREGIFDHFSIPLSPCWRPRTPANWSISTVGEMINAENSMGAYEFLFYDHPFQGDLKIRIWQTCRQITKRGTMGVILSIGTDMADSQGYEFAFIEGDKYVIYKNYNYDHYKDRGYWTYIKKPTLCPARLPGIDVPNSIEIIKVGNNYTFSVNDKFVFSFMDVRWDVRYVALGIFDQGMKVEYHEVLLNVGDISRSVPGQPAVEIPGKEGERGWVR